MNRLRICETAEFPYRCQNYGHYLIRKLASFTLANNIFHSRGKYTGFRINVSEKVPAESPSSRQKTSDKTFKQLVTKQNGKLQQERTAEQNKNAWIVFRVIARIVVL